MRLPAQQPFLPKQVIMRIPQSNRTGKQAPRSARPRNGGRSVAIASDPKTYERYLARAREAAQRGDLIEAENLYQHAEHYLRQMRGGSRG